MWHRSPGPSIKPSSSFFFICALYSVVIRPRLSLMSLSIIITSQNKAIFYLDHSNWFYHRSVFINGFHPLTWFERSTRLLNFPSISILPLHCRLLFCIWGGPLWRRVICLAEREAVECFSFWIAHGRLILLPLCTQTVWNHASEAWIHHLHSRLCLAPWSTVSLWIQAHHLRKSKLAVYDIVAIFL